MPMSQASLAYVLGKGPKPKTLKQKLKNFKSIASIRPRKGQVATVKQTKAIVKHELAKEIETKYVRVARGETHNSTISNADIIAVMPPLYQMDSSNIGAAWQRIGTKVSPKSLTFSVHWSINPSTTASTAIIVHYFILTSKSIKQTSLLQSNVGMTRLLRTGDSSLFGPFDGSIAAYQLPINDQEFTIIKRGSFKLQKNTGVVQDDSTAGNQPMINSVSHSKKFKIPCPAKFIYDQDSLTPRVINYPNGFAPFMVCGYTHQDGSAPDIANMDLKIVYSSAMWFDDA